VADDSDAEFLKRLEAITAPTSTGESAARGALLGGTLGWGPKLAAGVDTLTSKVPLLRDVAQQFHDPRFPPVNDPSATFDQRLAGYVGANRAAREEHPDAFRGAETTAAGLTSMAVPGGHGTAGALAGAAAGAGYDESNTVGGKLGSTLKGAAVGAAAAKLGSGLSAQAEKAGESSAAILRRELAGPQIGSSAGAKEARAAAYSLGDKLNREVESVEGLPAAIKSGDRRAQAAIANRVSSQLSQVNDEIYAHAAAKSREGGVPMSAVVDPLSELATKLRRSGQSAQAAEIDKIANSNVRVDMFSDGTVADPRSVREFLTKELQGKAGKDANLTLAERDAIAAREKAGIVIKDSLNRWVRDNAGETLAGKLEANNAKIRAMSTVADAAIEGGYVQEMGAPKAPAGGVMGAVKAKAGELGTPVTRFADTPAGQAILWGAAKTSKTLPAPLLDAMATKDPDAAKKAIAADLFGDAP